VLVYLLPFIEQDPLYKQINPVLLDLDANPVPSPWWTGTTSAWTQAQNKISTLLCPSDNAGDVTPTPPTGQTAAGVFAYFTTVTTATGATITGGYFQGNLPTGRTNYTGSAGCFGEPSNPGDFYGQWPGPFSANSKTKITDMNDGSSNTIFMGEILGGPGTGARQFVASWFGAGAMPLAWHLIDPGQWYSFGSKHTGVTQFSWGDGSVRPLRKIGATTPWFTTQWYTLMYAGGRSDNTVYDISLVGN
jgi:hypothetical protein